MDWDGPILTDSGGYQVFSLAHRRKLDADGVTFRSHLDGSLHRFTPETVMQIEADLGADIIMALDECPDPLDRHYNEIALQRTHAWAARCREAQRRGDQALFGIVQGGVFPDLRVQSARFLRSLDFPGYGIGGLAVGETKEQMYATLDITVPELPANGGLMTRRGRLNLRNAQYAADPRPVEEGCACACCRTFSRAYLRHLFKAGEILALRLATVHNLHFLLTLMADMRAAISAGRFDELRRGFLADYQRPDQETRHRQHAAHRQRLATGAGA